MKVPQEQIEFRKKVGKSRGKDVWHVKTRGGLHLISKENGEVLGTGSHRAIARRIAQQHEPDIEYTELSKSDHIEPEAYEHLLPEYEQLTADLRAEFFRNHPQE